MRIITAREQVEMLAPWRTASEFDPMKVTNRLKGEFYDWFDTLPDHRLQEIKNIKMHPFMDHHENNPVSHWPTVERFLKDKYPAAHRGFMTGREDASHWLDDPDDENESPMMENEDDWPEPYSSADHQKLGYDPQEVAAGMVLLHNRAHSGRQDSYLNTDKKRLVDIYNKRQQMQRNYEQRQAFWQRVAASGKVYRGFDLKMPPDLEALYHRHLQMPEEESEIGQHYKLADPLLDHLEANTSLANDHPGIGPNWSHSRHMSQEFAKGGKHYPVMVEADHPGDEHIDPDRRPDASEQEINYRPGTPVNVTGLYVPSPFQSGWLNVLRQPQARST